MTMSQLTWNEQTARQQFTQNNMHMLNTLQSNNRANGGFPFRMPHLNERMNDGSEQHTHKYDNSDRR